VFGELPACWSELVDEVLRDMVPMKAAAVSVALLLFTPSAELRWFLTLWSCALLIYLHADWRSSRAHGVLCGFASLLALSTLARGVALAPMAALMLVLVAASLANTLGVRIGGDSKVGRGPDQPI
jgi:hypothetical protein